MKANVSGISDMTDDNSGAPENTVGFTGQNTTEVETIARQNIFENMSQEVTSNSKASAEANCNTNTDRESSLIEKFILISQQNMQQLNQTMCKMANIQKSNKSGSVHEAHCKHINVQGSSVKQKKLQYERANLQKAYNATLTGMSVYRAARMYLVPESTLRDRTRNKVEMEPTFGFGTFKENKLVEHVTYMASIGYGYNKIGIRLCITIGKSIQSKSTLSNCWFYGLIKRWPDLKRWNPDFLNGCIPGSSGGVSESGWSNSQLFHDYVTTHFIKYASVPVGKDLEPTLLLYDNDSQVAPSVIYRVCEDEERAANIPENTKQDFVEASSEN
ncbi:hypothetical protein KUTeg_011734 [Tegillarca granosa]|uniref:HTH psq-type domain-containing protein n=1 Tax=Tegillarca granosa TaxID=220873 RepID=A0ABQ9EXS1_TEGGR|nr:hypothetical protein KUTeg_011734 [Tegillarca granosa]